MFVRYKGFMLRKARLFLDRLKRAMYPKGRR